MEEERGRIFQDDTFLFTEFDGLKLQKLVVCENPETKEPVIVYLKVENHNWHQYFLDIGIGFWEDWNFDELEIEEDDSFSYIDKTSEFNLFERTIAKIWCEPEQNNSRITIAFESGEKLILKTTDPETFDSESLLLIIK
ncbi:hypothetical protein [Flavobacterium gelatinilyticum]|uniref:hypothetical protein n=1 Tax=Flavobacterium gelatinilyticum TaxID=3003260 RepID=UPI002481071E|nr:hypothetical protein [Flavobacterium gelatinilyticum]